MSRISSLFLASGLAILPIVAFAQQTAAPAATPAAQPAPAAPQMSKSDMKAPAPGLKATGAKTEAKTSEVKTPEVKTSEAKTPEAKTTASTKDAKSMHAKSGTKTVPATAKPAEPGKS